MFLIYLFFIFILYCISIYLNKSDFIVFNSNENTYDDVIQLIRNNNKKYESIGIFQNNSNESYYQFSKKEEQCLLENDSSLTSWNESRSPVQMRISAPSRSACFAIVAMMSSASKPSTSKVEIPNAVTNS